jgi:hypothetical protein
MLGDHGAIYCDRCELLAPIYVTVFVYKVWAGERLSAWWEVCPRCARSRAEWCRQHVTRIRRRSNVRRLGPGVYARLKATNFRDSERGVWRVLAKERRNRKHAMQGRG